MDSELKQTFGKILKHEQERKAIEQADHSQLMQNLAKNMTEKDAERFREGYVPLLWLLAKMTYNEASLIGELRHSMYEMIHRYSLPQKSLWRRILGI